MSTPVLDHAGRYVAAGFSVIPVRADGSKRPAVAWAEYQHRRPTDAELQRWFADGTAGIALLGGRVSGSFEVIDFDITDAYDEWCDNLKARGISSLLDRVSLTRTPRPGVHVCYRAEAVGPNRRLAQRRIDGQWTTLCETRGEGGYVLAPGSPPACHPRGSAYEPMGGVPLTDLTPLGAGCREALLSAARLLSPRRIENAQGIRPSTLFNQSGPSWEALLEPAGWVKCGEHRGVQHWRRPGKRHDGTSATVGACYSKTGEELFYVFSTKAAPFEPNVAYNKFAVFALLHHGGDWRKAALSLRGARGVERGARSVERGAPDTTAVEPSTLSAARSTLRASRSAPGAPRNEEGLQILTLAGAKPLTVRWLWYPWLPCGALTLLDGDPGLGKSTLTLDLAARLSRGDRFPDDEPGSNEPAADAGHVLLLSAEDDVHRTILPRLQAAGADLDRVHVLTHVHDQAGDRLPQLPWDLADALAGLPPVKLVVIDPLMAFLGMEFDACKDQHVRRCLHALSKLAEQYQTTLLLVRHLNKTAGPQALYRGSGSIGILGAARACLLAGRDPEQEGQVVLAMNKCNLAPTPVSLGYTLETVANVSRLKWLGPVCWQANDLVGKPAKERPADACAAYVREILEQGPREARVLEALCAARGWTKNIYQRARQQANVQATKLDFQGKWMCHLPGRPANPALDELFRGTLPEPPPA
jgi:hypothetical protein